MLLARILCGHAPSLTSPLGPVEVEALPSHRVVLSQWSPVTYFHHIPLPLRRRVLRCCSSRACPEPIEGLFAPSVAFTPHEKLGAFLFPFRG